MDGTAKSQGKYEFDGTKKKKTANYFLEQLHRFTFS